MATNTALSFSFAGLPEGYCFSGFDRFALDIVNGMSGFIPGEYSVIIKSETEPDAEDRSKDWHKLLPGGAPTGKLYSYYLGKWVSPHPKEASGSERMWWDGTEADLWSYDGGDGTDPATTAPTATTGAMWEADETYAFRTILGAGTSPKPTTVNPGDTGGVEEVTLTANQLPEHEHQLFTNEISENYISVPSQNDYVVYWGSYMIATKSPANITPSIGLTGPIGGGEVVTNMMPYKVGIMAKRTARQYYVG